MSRDSTIPTHVIAGPLGVGKTTAIIELLKQRQGREHVVVLVNDFGTVGIDSALVDDEDGKNETTGLTVKSIPGGCICCTAAAGLSQTLKQVLAMPGVDRIIVEPSGVVATGQLVDVLKQIGGDDRIDLHPVVVIVDPSTATSDMVEKMPYFSKLVEAAEILVANRCDLASESVMSDFRDWSSSLYPQPTRIIETTHGQLPPEIFNLERDRVWEKDHHHDHHHHHHHAHDEAYVGGGLQWPDAVIFDAAVLQESLIDLCERFQEGRFKSIFHTTAGWNYYDIARGTLNRRMTEYRRDNRVDWILPEADAAGFDDATLKHQLESALAQ